MIRKKVISLIIIGITALMLVSCASNGSASEISSAGAAESDEVTETSEKTTQAEEDISGTKSDVTEDTENSRAETKTSEETAESSETKSNTEGTDSTADGTSAAAGGTTAVNSSEVSDGEVSLSSNSNYVIRVNLAWQCVTVYSLSDGQETPVKAFACSTARNAYSTPEGEYYTGWWAKDANGYCYMADGTYGMYAYAICRASDGKYQGYMFHTVPMLSAQKGTLEWAEYDKLGSTASMGCIRLCMADAKWLVSNVGPGAKIVVYTDASSPGPLGKPATLFIPAELTELRGWDPTDSSSANPWHGYSFSMDVQDVIYVNAGDSSFSISDYVSATDNYGHDLSIYAKYSYGGAVYGFYYTCIDPEAAADSTQESRISYGYSNMDLSLPGEYAVSVSISVGSASAKEDVKIIVQ